MYISSDVFCGSLLVYCGYLFTICCVYAFSLFCNQKKLVPKGKKNQEIFDMTLYDSYFETICDDVASKTVTFTGCEKSHLMCNVALIHFPSAKSTQVRKI